jgi:hypothetical protein
MCSLYDLSEFVLHELGRDGMSMEKCWASHAYLGRALGEVRDRHEPCMPVLPVVRCEHRGYILKRRRKNDFAAQCTGETVEALFVHVRIVVIGRVPRRLAKDKASVAHLRF